MKKFSELYKRITLLLLAILIFILLGMMGLMYSEGMSTLDALWYSVMTLTTVGFGVPENFSDVGKTITIFLMLFGVGSVLYGLTALSLEFFDGNFAKEYQRNQIKRRMKNLKNHIIICGFGRNGRQAARKLILHQKPFVIVASLRRFIVLFFAPHKLSQNSIFHHGVGVRQHPPPSK